MAGLFETVWCFEFGSELCSFYHDSISLHGWPYWAPVVFNHCPGAGVEEVATNTQVKVFPNPFEDQTTIYSQTPLRNATIVISDLFGKEVRRMNNVSGETIKITRENLKSGIYFLRIIKDFLLDWHNNVYAILFVFFLCSAGD